jgi:hypothetical protein
MRRLLLLALVVSFFLPARAWASCYGVTPPLAPITPDGNVCGTVDHYSFNGSYTYYNKNAGQTYVKICPAGSTSGCTTATSQPYSDPYGNSGQSFLFYRYRYGASSSANYDLYAWSTSSTDYWGSSTKPIRKNLSINGTGWEGLPLHEPPRPLQPTPVYPSGTNVPNSYQVRWKSGRNLDRDASLYLMTYDIYFKQWSFGDTEPTAWTLSRAGMPCDDNGSNVPNANNECTTTVVGPQTAGNWKWYVVANLDASPYYYPGTILSTASGSMSFAQPNP